MRFSDFFSKVLLLVVGFYRTLGVIFFGGCCRYYPSCSEYAVQALRTRSVGLAVKLIVFRLLRCHPWGGSGFDPLPIDEGRVCGQ